MVVLVAQPALMALMAVAVAVIVGRSGLVAVPAALTQSGRRHQIVRPLARPAAAVRLVMALLVRAALGFSQAVMAVAVAVLDIIM